MKVQELIGLLSKIDPEKDIGLVVNIMNPEDPEDDIACEHLEIWDNGSECIDLFIRK